MMEDFAASMFSSEVASCWPRNSKRETRPPSEARASEMTSMAPSTSDMADSAAVMVATLALIAVATRPMQVAVNRSEEPTSELQSLMRISYAVFCLKTKYNHILIVHH